MGNLTACRIFERDIDGPGPSADAGIIWATKRKLHQGKNGVNEPLNGAQREAKDVF